MIKNKLYEFDPQVYPRKLWVLYNPSYHTMAENFLQNEEEISFEQYSSLKHADNGFTASVMNKNDLSLGVLIVLFKKPSINTISHECVHFADCVYEELGITSQNYSEGNEPYAYLVGWASGCIESILKKGK